MASLLKGLISLPTVANQGLSTSSSSRQGVKRRRLPSLGAAWGGIKRRAMGAASPQACRILPGESALATVTNCISVPIPFSVLADGPYLVVASWLDAQDLARTDVTCQLLRGLNSQPIGPWQNIGEQAFFGMELDSPHDFFAFASRSVVDWKAHYRTFHTKMPTFSAPFQGREISVIERPDEVAYCRCRLRSDLLSARDECCAYVEVEIFANADNLSLALVDFEGGGRSSVTFSPETGAVLREQKVREAPRAIEGTYIHLLPAAPANQRFKGRMGLYLKNGHLAFFRKWSAAPLPTEGGAGTDGANSEVQEQSWETTGFCTDLHWAYGERLSLCLAFRDPGHYHVRIIKVCRTPPIAPHTSEVAYKTSRWNHLYGDDDHPLAI